ncbi:MAG: peptide deformylase [Clostridia bacterium]
MAIRKIILKGDECLSKKCRDVTTFDRKLKMLIEDMKETMIDLNGVGLAGPQIGMLRNIAIVLNVETEEIIEIINPKILESSGEESGLEGCLSIPDVYGYVARPTYIKIEYQNRKGKLCTLEANDFLARTVFHELDHLNGNLFDVLVTEFVDASELNLE